MVHVCSQAFTFFVFVSRFQPAKYLYIIPTSHADDPAARMVLLNGPHEDGRLVLLPLSLAGPPQDVTDVLCLHFLSGPSELTVLLHAKHLWDWIKSNGLRYELQYEKLMRGLPCGWADKLNRCRWIIDQMSILKAKRTLSICSSLLLCLIVSSQPIKMKPAWSERWELLLQRAPNCFDYCIRLTVDW